MKDAMVVSKSMPLTIVRKMVMPYIRRVTIPIQAGMINAKMMEKV